MQPWALLIRTALKTWPQTARLLRDYGPVVAANGPKAAELARQFYGKVAAAQQGRSQPERLRRTIEVVRANARRLEAGAPDETTRERARGWAAHSDSLLQAVDLLAVQQGRRRRAALKAVHAEVDLLMAEVLGALMTAPAAAPATQDLEADADAG